MTEEQQPQNTEVKNKVMTLIWLWIARIGLWSVALFVIIAVLLQLPPVQNYIARQIARTLSKELDTKVELDYVYLAYLDRLTMRRFYVEDFNGDTLLYSGKLQADFVLNPFVLFRQGLTVEEIRLTDANFNLRTLAPSNKSNLELLLEKLFPPKDKKSESRPFQLDIQRIYLQDVSFLEDNQTRGNRFYAALSRGYISFKTFDLPSKRLEIKSIDLREPIVKIESFPVPAVPVNIATSAIDTTGEDTTSTRIIIENFLLRNGQFALHNYRRAPVKTTPNDEIDYEHLDVFNINIDIHNFALLRDTFQGNIKSIALRERSGFILNELAAKDAIITPRSVGLYNFHLITPYTQLGDTLIFKYRDYDGFSDFNNKVLMEGHVNNSAVALRDIMVFAPGLKENTFFNKNKNEVIEIDGEVRGSVNTLRVRDLNLRLSDGSVVQGNFSSRNLAVKNEEILNLRLDRLSTRVRTLRELIPGLSLPPSFDRLGRLNFKGSFDGFFSDFVAYGDLNTDIGRAVMDMRMNLKNGIEKAGYSGKLSLRNFDLGKWSNNPDFGLVTFTSEVKNGVGLRAQTASAQLTAEIQNFTFKNYNYQNARLDGQLNRNLFNGNFVIQDENVDFKFRGLLNYKDSIPVFDFQATINKIDLKKLNLAKADLVLSGRVDLNLSDDRFSYMQGEAAANNLHLIYNGNEQYDIAYIEAMSYFDSLGNKVFQVESDAMKAFIRGKFDIEQIPEAFIQYFQRNYPKFASRLGIKPNRRNINTADFTYNIEIIDSKGINRIVDAKLGRLRDVKISGLYDGTNDSLMLQLDLPSLKYNDIQVNDAAVTINLLKDQGWLDLYITSTVLNDKQTLEPITILSFMKKDTMEFGINYYSDGLLDNLTLEGFFYPVDSTLFQVQFKQSNLVILEMPWQIDPGNQITFGKNHIEAKNFTLQSNRRKLILETQNNKGVKVSLSDFNFSVIDQIWDDEVLEFGGTFDMIAQVDDLFKMENIQVNMLSDTLLVNGCNLGTMNGDVVANNLKSPLDMSLLIRDGTSRLTARGTYNLADLAEADLSRPVALEQLSKYFDFQVGLQRFPLCILEEMVAGVFSQIEGEVDGEVRINGAGGKPNINGKVDIMNGMIAVDYLKTAYTFPKSEVKIGNYLFDASGTVLYDKYGHKATVQGGLRHNRLRDMGVDARLRTPRFLVLDTKKEDNNLFYGHAIASGDVRFNGPFDRIDIYITATANDSARLVIPLSTAGDATKLTYINFVDKSKEEEAKNQPLRDRPELKGVRLEMNLTIRDEAQVELVFNEQTGEVIRGSGRGNIRILMPRNGSFQMFGDYNIQDGDYLFSLYNVVNKNFRVREGGNIRWTGDPMAAQINIEAEYTGLNTSVANFIQEYLANASSEVKSNASQATNVVLLLHLQGDLRQPIINFNIEFPALTGELKNYADNKLRVLKQDQNELNRQVFGLIVVGQFLPTDFALQGSEIIYNTVSEFVSNQLSLLLTELFSDLITDGRVLSGIDLDIAYNQYQSVDLGEGQAFNRGDEFQVQLRQNFFNDRLSVLVGGNLDIGTNARTAAAAGTFFGNDVVIEYVLNKDRSLKLRVYQRLQPDIGGGRRFQVGTGISFRKEFDSFGEFIRDLRGQSKKLKENQ
ncbi:MAG: translocation/assembly module TamB domain-containing protein [Saprospiraceae bacterium]